MGTSLRRQWVQRILEETTDDRKFEQFAADFCTAFYEREFVTTSANYDLGADARSADSEVRSCVCATLQNTAGKPIKGCKDHSV